MIRSISLLLVGFIVGCGSSASEPTGSGTGGSSATSEATGGGGASGGGGSGGADGGASAGGGGASSAEPITAPDDVWTWIDFPDSKCASGTPTGIGVNLHKGATDVLIYLEGGGSCTSGESCWGASPEAANLAGYDAATFMDAPQRGYPIFQRDLATNPFRNLNLVYIPYCTGDLHGGTAETDLDVDGQKKPTYFWGGRDMDVFLARLGPTFPKAKRVTLAGTSAGGFGTIFNFDKVTHAFNVRVDVIDDSGPPIAHNGAPPNHGSTGGLWGIEPPPACPSCETFEDIFHFDRTSQPSSQFAFLSFASDPVISSDFGYTLDEYAQYIADLQASLVAPHEAAFVVTNETRHVVETDPAWADRYLPWMTAMTNQDPAFVNETYAHP
jgi:hypothetical protein